MFVTAGENLNGQKILEYKNVIFGVANSKEGAMYRQSALDKLIHAAEISGANAIVNFRMEIYQIDNGVTEATAYGNAVVVNNPEVETKTQKVNLEAFIPKDKVAIGELLDTNGYKFVVCPKCKSKYKADIDEKGNVKIKGFDDVDDSEPGLQIYCLRCGTKFTVPESK